jgi:hypothetical protein
MGDLADFHRRHIVGVRLAVDFSMCAADVSSYLFTHSVKPIGCVSSQYVAHIEIVRSSLKMVKNKGRNMSEQ